MDSVSTFFFLLLPLVFSITLQPLQVSARQVHATVGSPQQAHTTVGSPRHAHANVGTPRATVGPRHAHVNVGSPKHGGHHANLGSPKHAPGHDLITETCKDAVNVNLCLFVLKSDHNSNHADLLGLANIAITYTMNNASGTTKHIAGLVDKTDDGGFQGALEDCSNFYEDALDQFETAYGTLSSKNYTEVSILVQAALTLSESCQEGLEKVGSHPILKDINTVFAQLCGNVLTILNLLPAH